MGELRERKKRETRQRISDIATALFFERGFDAVTLDEIALAAGVSKMTVFNYFARKEELILDQEDELKLVRFRTAIRERSDGQAPIDAIRALVRDLSAQKHPITRIDPQTAKFWSIVEASPALRARLRELADEAAEGLAIELAGSANPDGPTRLMGGIIALTLRTAREEAIRLVEHGASAKKAHAAFLELIELGLSAVETVR